jgi:hypothetical protein
MSHSKTVFYVIFAKKNIKIKYTSVVFVVLYFNYFCVFNFKTHLKKSMLYFYRESP